MQFIKVRFSRLEIALVLAIVVAVGSVRTGSASYVSEHRREDHVFGVVMSTGRCATKFLFQALRCAPGTKCVIKFEYESPEKYTFMTKVVHPAMAHNDTVAMSDYVKSQKIPRMLSELEKADASIYVDTGHQVVLGMLDTLLDELGDSLRIIRLRRDRLSTAASFAGDPTKKDPCRYTFKEDYLHYCPFHKAALVQPVSPAHWDKMNLFQKYLWWVDEVEAQWSRLLERRGNTMHYMEVNFSGPLSESQVASMAEFLGVSYDLKAARRTSVNHHNTAGFGKIWMKLKDFEYRGMMPNDTIFSF